MVNNRSEGLLRSRLEVVLGSEIFFPVFQCG